jgi:hypothetical protein
MVGYFHVTGSGQKKSTVAVHGVFLCFEESQEKGIFTVGTFNGNPSIDRRTKKEIFSNCFFFV